MNKLPALFDKVTPFVSSENQWIVASIFVSLTMFAFVFKHYKEWNEFRINKKKNQIDTLKQLAGDIDEKLYRDTYNLEMKQIYFSLICNKYTHSIKKSELLLNLLNREILTKKEIKKYLSRFKICKNKIYIKINIMDWIEMVFFMTLSIMLLLFAWIIVVNLNGVMTLYIAFIVILFTPILIIFSLFVFMHSLNVLELRKLIKVLKEKGFYSEHCC